MTHEIAASSGDCHPILQTQIDLTAALRMAYRLGLSEGICNHFSALVPGQEHLCCINPQGLHWSEITPADIMVVDSSGCILQGEHPVEPSAFFIHLHVHKQHPNARCVMHAHSPYATALTLLDGGRLEPVSQNALRFYGKVAYDDHYNGLAVDDREGERIAKCLGSSTILMMASHGVIVCSDSIAGAFDDLYYLERACMVQVHAMSTGRPLRRISEKIAAETVRQIDEDRTQMRLHFDALKRVLDRDEPEWRGTGYRGI